MAFVLTLVAAAGLAAGCGGNQESETPAPETTAPVETAPPPPPPPKTAMAMIQPLGSNQISGQVTFTEAAAGGVDVQVMLQNATGEHGIHVHEGGECGSDGKAAGPHWNPQNDKHGMLGSSPHHMGDLGNITGGNLTMHVAEWTIGDGGPSDVVGHTVVVHAKADDLKTDPAGNSGDRIACGAITMGGGTPTETPMGTGSTGTEMTPGSGDTSQPGK
jgi:Cu-Zn family superoxide dismutase